MYIYIYIYIHTYKRCWQIAVEPFFVDILAAAGATQRDPNPRHQI